MSAAPQRFQDPRHAGLILGLFSGTLTVLAALVLPLPVLYYLPELGGWSASPAPGVIAMSYYGVAVWGVGGVLLGWGLARVPPIAAALQRRAGAGLLTISAAGVVVLGMLYCLVAELARWGAG